MLSDYYGCYKDPAWMAKNLEFDANGRVFWGKVSARLCFNFIFRIYNHKRDTFINAIKEPSMSCMLEIKSRHWVVATKAIPGGYLTADPWNGTRGIALNSTVSGGTIFKKK